MRGTCHVQGRARKTVESFGMVRAGDAMSATVAFCPECGARSEGGRFCESCGNPLPEQPLDLKPHTVHVAGRPSQADPPPRLDSFSKASELPPVRILPEGTAKPLAAVLVGVGIAVGIAVAISSGGSSGSAASSLPATQPDVAATASSPPPTAPLLPMGTNVTLNLSADGGYTGAGTLQLGALRHASAGLQNGALTLGAACQVDDETDAVIPFAMSVTNTSSGFSAAPGFSFSLSQSSDAELAMSAEVNYSDGPQCTTLADDDVSFAASNPMAPQDSTTPAPGFLIISNYYSPTYPSGDALSFSAADPALDFAGGGTDQTYSVQGATGASGSSDSGYSLSLLLGSG
jgi:hypothetical protein